MSKRSAVVGSGHSLAISINARQSERLQLTETLIPDFAQGLKVDFILCILEEVLFPGLPTDQGRLERCPALGDFVNLILRCQNGRSRISALHLPWQRDPSREGP